MWNTEQSQGAAPLGSAAESAAPPDRAALPTPPSCLREPETRLLLSWKAEQRQSVMPYWQRLQRLQPHLPGLRLRRCPSAYRNQTKCQVLKAEQTQHAAAFGCQCTAKLWVSSRQQAQQRWHRIRDPPIMDPNLTLLMSRCAACSTTQREAADTSMPIATWPSTCTTEHRSPVLPSCVETGTLLHGRSRNA